MASTNKTTNYELSQFIETDRPAWLTDYNGDMRTIDSTMKAISDVASGASSSISELADRMSTAEGNISTNTNDIATLDARADSLEAQAQSTAGTIANIQTEQTAQNLGIEAATELGYNLARPYDSASTYAVGAYVLFQNTLYKCITAVSTGEAFDPSKWLAIKATDEIAAGGYTLPIASANTLGGVKVGDGLSIDENGVLSAGGVSTDYHEYNSIASAAATSEFIWWDLMGGGSTPQTYYHTGDTITHSSLLTNAYVYIIGDIAIINLRLFSNISTTATSAYGALYRFKTTYTLDPSGEFTTFINTLSNIKVLSSNYNSEQVEYSSNSISISDRVMSFDQAATTPQAMRYFVTLIGKIDNI